MDRGLWNASFDKLLERILERLGLLDGGSSISLTASRGVVTDANKLLSSDVAATGTGAPVRQTSPTLITPALGTPSSGDLQNCTFAAKANVSLNRSSAPAAITSFAGTISAASLTATFTEAADYALCVIGSTIISNAQTRYVAKLLGSSQVTLDQTTTWAASSAITSIQGPQQVSDVSSTAITFVAANGSITTVLVSNGSILFHRTVDGKEGIGTTAPVGKLHVKLGSNELAIFTDGSAASGIWGRNIGFLSQATQAQIVGSADAPLVFKTGGTENTMTSGSEWMRITTAGNVGIGTIDLDGTPAVGKITAKGTTNDGSTLIFVGRDSDEANVITIDTDGDILNSAGVYGTISDAKIKDNIQDATVKLPDILKLKVRNFNLIGSDLKQIGLVAQEMETVFPSLVKSTPDMERVPDPDWKPSIKTRQVEEVSEVEEIKTEIVEVEGKYVRKTITTTVEKKTPLFDIVPLYDDKGNQIFDTIPGKPEVLDENGNVLEPATPDVITSALHQVPRMEEYTEDESARPMIVRPTGTVTKSIKQSVLIPILLKAVQELAAEVATLKKAKK